MLQLPVARATKFVLVRPHYPENVGAAARALKTMGMVRLALVKPGRLAVPEHEMARKMSVRSWDVLDAAERHGSLVEAIAGVTLTLGTSARRGIRGVLSPRDAARLSVEHAAGGGTIAVVLGNEKTGLSTDDLARCHERVRIPMAADQPSINLAQAVQVLAYELFVAGLEARARRSVAG